MCTLAAPCALLRRGRHQCQVILLEHYSSTGVTYSAAFALQVQLCPLRLRPQRFCSQPNKQTYILYCVKPGRGTLRRTLAASPRRSPSSSTAALRSHRRSSPRGEDQGPPGAAGGQGQGQAQRAQQDHCESWGWVMCVPLACCNDRLANIKTKAVKTVWYNCYGHGVVMASTGGRARTATLLPCAARIHGWRSRTRHLNIVYGRTARQPHLAACACPWRTLCTCIAAAAAASSAGASLCNLRVCCCVVACRRRARPRAATSRAAS